MKNLTKQFINNNYIQGFLNLLSLIIIIWSMFISIKGIGFVIESSITNNLLDSNNIKEVLSSIFKSHSSLIMVPIFLMLFSLFKKSITIQNVAISILLSFLVPSYEYTDNILHPYLFSLGVFNFLLRDGQTILNPQYTKLFIFISLIFILLVKVLFKKYRSIDRVFILLISSSVIITTFIFHIALPMGMFKYTKNQLEQDLKYKVENISLEVLCKDIVCFVLNDKMKVIKSNHNEEFLDKYDYYLNYIKDFYQKPENKDVLLSNSISDFKGQQFDYIITLTQKINNGYIVVMDSNVAKSYGRQSELWFSFLSSIAHFIWIFGGIGLLFLHKKRFFRRKMNV